MANGKGHFGPTDRNDQTGHSGPPSKLVPNIPVGPNRNGPFHLMNQPKFPDFWVEWKAPQDSKVKTSSVFPTFCHATFHHFLIRRAVMYPEQGTIAQVYLDRDTFDFIQGHVTKLQPMAVPV